MRVLTIVTITTFMILCAIRLTTGLSVGQLAYNTQTELHAYESGEITHYAHNLRTFKSGENTQKESGVKESGEDTQGDRKQVPIGAVVTDHEACSDVGRDILVRGGSAVDAAIAALLCNGVRTPHSMGIGGGCFMVIYDKLSKKAVAIDGREVAPIAATAKMFSNFTGYNIGSKMIGVPGELLAYRKAHQMYGKLPWKSLFMPAIKMAVDGHPLGNSTARALTIVAALINVTNIPNFCEIFCKDGRVLREGETVRMPKLGRLLRRIAKYGPEFIYTNDKRVHKLVKEINQAGGIFQHFDFTMYNKTKDYPAVEFNIGGYKLYTTGAPSGGPVLELILNILKGFNITAVNISSTEKEAELFHKMIEAFKFAHADKLYMGDPDFVQIQKRLEKMKSEDYAAYIRCNIDPAMTHNVSYYTNLTAEDSHSFGTSHMSVLSPSGDAVSVTSTINFYFGSLVISKSTGIIWNNVMADFTFKENKTSPLQFQANKVEPSKKPLSSIAPVIMTDKKGNVELVVGAAGGSKIVNIVLQILVRVLWLNQTLAEAMGAKRISHTLIPNELDYENGVSKELLHQLEAKGHRLASVPNFLTVVEGILVKDGQIEAVSDKRKLPGKPSYVYRNKVLVSKRLERSVSKDNVFLKCPTTPSLPTDTIK
ncbi:hypothetical protein CHS0354_010306, partial [Potamilus streckersoni]